MPLVRLQVLVILFSLIPPIPAPIGAQRLTSHPAADYHPKWSPDGQTILFTSQRGGRTGIWRLPAEGGTPLHLPTGREGDHHIAWSPDMTQIVFDAQDEDGRPSLWILVVETGEIRRALPPGDRGPKVHPTWSPDGSRIAFTTYRAGSSELGVMSLEDASVRRLTNELSSYDHPWWSPDGTTIAFDSDHTGNRDIWMVDADGGNLRQITANPQDELHPCVSPDPRLIAFTRRGDGGDRVWIRSLVDGREVPLPTTFPCGWPTWSPEGSRMACSARIEGSLDIVVVDTSDLVAALLR